MGNGRPKKASDYEIGEQVYEAADYCAGFLVSTYNDPKSTDRIYMLLCNEKKEYTIYVVLKNAVCAPWVARFIPEEVIKYFYSEVFNEETIVRVAVI